MRLATRLILPHVAVALLLGSALVYLTVALVRMTSIIDEIQADHLDDFEQEERLHRAAWNVEVAIRHGGDACERPGADVVEVSRRVVVARDALAKELRSYQKKEDPLGEAAKRYEKTATDVVSGDVCAKLVRITSAHDRLMLDEELTNAWIARVDAIRDAFEAKEVVARRMGGRGVVVGAGLTLFSWLVATALARRLTRSINGSLSELASRARRVGEGDFAPLGPLSGPHEIRALSLDLDRMRAKLSEVESLKQAFVASVSHDLRSPLGRLREALSMLGDGTLGPLNEKQGRVVALARDACEREIRLVNALLDLSRIRSGRPLQREEGCSVDGIVRAALADVADEAAAAAVRVELALAPDVPTGAFDAILVERAIVNVLSNAISVSPRGGVVRLSSRLADGDGGAPEVEIVVSDEGPGVPPLDRERIFDAHVSSRSAGRVREGVGLGLSISREMVRAHGGDVRVVDGVGPGAAFSIRLPLAGGGRTGDGEPEAT